MKIFRSVTIAPERCPQDLYAHVVRMKPEAQRGSIFHLEAKPGDDQSARLVDLIVALCKERGLDKVRGAYSHMVDRVYDAADFQTAPLLLLETQRKMFQDAERRDERGRLSLLAGQAKPSVKIGSIYPRPWIVVTEAVRRNLELGGFVGLEFGEVLVKGRSSLPRTGLFWEVWSRLLLPKMSNSILYEDSPFPAYAIVDPPFHTVEPHYRASELKPVGRFDVAQTLEPLGGPDRHLIVSQSFYQYCLRNKMPIRVRPVRIDPE